MLSALELVDAFPICRDVQGLLKYGIGYWRRMRRVERWHYMRTLR